MTKQRQTGVPYLEATLLPAHEDEVLELDEVWSFVASKKNKVWIWLALCRRTRQIVAWWYGPRDKLSCWCLWENVPAAYKSGLCYTDFYASYKSIVPPQKHRPCAKKEGQTNHIERFNLTLRQSVARLVRKTLSFSKKVLPHIQALRLFFVHYNERVATRYLKANTSP
ncbi:MAG: IS1 family transposase [Pseudomonas sp.]|nr:MAG: IS1 family transposase [Pseudomonas sp.]